MRKSDRRREKNIWESEKVRMEKNKISYMVGKNLRTRRWRLSEKETKTSESEKEFENEKVKNK